ARARSPAHQQLGPCSAWGAKRFQRPLHRMTVQLTPRRRPLWKIAVVYRSGGMCDGDVSHMILQPINADGTSVWKQGRAIPAKFRVCDVECLSAPQGSWQVSI